MLDMTAYLDNVSKAQNFDLFTDTVTVLCAITCTDKKYTLVYASTLAEVPSDLVGLYPLATQPALRVRTKNYLYTGDHLVKIKCQIVHDDVAETTTYAFGEEFTITVDACNTASCAFTKLIKLDALTETLPTSYSIGVDNQPGTITFSNYKNTVGQSCATNNDICGSPTYQILYQNGASPDFSTLTSGTSFQTQSSQTILLTDVGDHSVYVAVTLDLTPFQKSSIYAQSDYFTITIDECSPLPCDYNQIFLPTGDSAVLPTNMYVITDGSVSTESFSTYEDDVSQRCQVSVAYSALCGSKSYIVEQVSDGSVLPITVSITYNAATSLWQIDASSNDETLADIYYVRLHASFDTATSLGTASDEYSHEFEITVEVVNPCLLLNCTRNQLDINRVGYTEPSNFTIDVTLTWNETIFDNYNDVKTERCYLQPGSTIDGVAVASWGRPVCGDMIYELVDAETLQPMTQIFGKSNIEIEYFQETTAAQQWVIRVRSNDKSLDGDHEVMLSVRLFEDDTPQYSQEFTITVQDPCQPYDCTTTAFSPISDYMNPYDIAISVGEGYVQQSQSQWTDSVTEVCGSSNSVLLCDTPDFELFLSNGTEVPFTYEVNVRSSQILLNVIITEEYMAGETYEVYLRGYGLDSSGYLYGTNGTTVLFNIIIDETIGEAPDYFIEETSASLPYFEEFPDHVYYSIGSAATELQLVAIAASDIGIESLSVDLKSAVGFVEVKVTQDTATFVVSLSSEVVVFTYTIDVIATDYDGNKYTQTFAIDVFELTEDPQGDQSSAPSTDGTLTPLEASITSISLTGLIQIDYNRRVIPIANVSSITTEHFHLSLRQNSDEFDITQDFRYQVVEYTPYRIFAQMVFSQPFDVSQGLTPDFVQVQMVRSWFMVEDTEGLYLGWSEGDPIVGNQEDASDRAYFGKYFNETLYAHLNETLPKLVASEAEAELLEESSLRLEYSLQALFWGPFIMHILGFGTMEFVWIIFNNLQIIACMSQFDLKMPKNVIVVIETYANIANQNFIPLSDFYAYLREMSSDSDNPNINVWGKDNWDYSGADKRIQVADNGRRMLQATTTEDSEIYRFEGKGSSVRVLETSTQMILFVALLSLIGLSGLVLQYTFLYLHPSKLQKAFHWVRTRLFWCLPIRMLLQQYMCITMAAFLNLRFQAKTETTEQKVNMSFSILILIFYSVGFIIFVFVFLHRNRNYIRDVDMRKRFDSLYLSLELDKQWAIPMAAFSLIRKLLLISVAVSFRYNVVQIWFALYIQQFYANYVLTVKPLTSNLRDWIEMLNESTLIMILLSMSLLTDYVPSPSLRYQIGWFLIYAICLQVAINTVFLLMQTFVYLKRIYKILKYHSVIRQQSNVNRRHNQVVDKVLRRQINQEAVGTVFVASNDTYKKRNPILQEQLAVILSEGSLEQSSSLQRSIHDQRFVEDVDKVKSITQRKKEFNAMMQAYTSQDKHETFEHVRRRVDTQSQLLTDDNQQTDPLQSKSYLQTDYANNFDYLIQNLQRDNAWPVSKQEAQTLSNQRHLNLPGVNTGQPVWQWQVEKDDGQQWDALPLDYDNFEQLSISMFSEQDSAVKNPQSDKHSTPVPSYTKKKSQLVLRSKLDLSVPDANQNSMEKSKWKDDDSMLFEDSFVRYSHKDKDVNKKEKEKESGKLDKRSKGEGRNASQGSVLDFTFD